MKVQIPHRWDVSPSEAALIQKKLALEATAESPDGFEPRIIAAADVSCERYSKRMCAAIAVVSYPELDIIETATAALDTNFPYVPGLLSFREAPAVLMAFEKLKSLPDAVMIDGHGMAHPRGFGLARHIGLAVDLPTFGVAKSLLVGEYSDLGNERGDKSDIIYKGKPVGVALRTRTGVKPVFVSVGHKIDIETALIITLECARRVRLPYPARLAHVAANDLRKKKTSAVS
jgi:deoxyribonuclease V